VSPYRQAAPQLDDHRCHINFPRWCNPYACRPAHRSTGHTMLSRAQYPWPAGRCREPIHIERADPTRYMINVPTPPWWRRLLDSLRPASPYRARPTSAIPDGWLPWCSNRNRP
jgi:hypothetical protein